MTKRDERLQCEILEHYGTYDEKSTWHGEVNLVSWHGADPKIDIRKWNADHTSCSKGVGLSKEDARMLAEILIRI